MADDVDHRAGGEAQAPGQQHDPRRGSPRRRSARRPARSARSPARSRRTIGLANSPARAAPPPRPAPRARSAARCRWPATVPLAMSPPPKPMPTAMPSGKLWMVMAMHEQPDLAPAPGVGAFAAVDEVFMRHQLVHHRHDQRAQRDAARRDEGGVSVTLPYCSVAASSPGRISEKNDADIITPAAKPSSVSSSAADAATEQHRHARRRRSSDPRQGWPEPRSG